MRASTTAAVLGLLLALSTLAGCSSDDSRVVALLVADGGRLGAQPVDVEAFEARVEQRCEECRVVVHDAGGDADEQADQLRRVEADSAEVVVIDPVDPDDVQQIPVDDVEVISLANFVPGSDYFVGVADGFEPDEDLPRDLSDLKAAREIILGDRLGMTYVPARAMSEQAADVAVAVLAGDEAPDAVDHDGVPAWLFETKEVRLADVTTVLVGDGAMTIEELCEGKTARRCRSIGLR